MKTSNDIQVVAPVEGQIGQDESITEIYNGKTCLKSSKVNFKIERFADELMKRIGSFKGCLAGLISAMLFGSAVVCVRLLPQQNDGIQTQAQAIFFRGWVTVVCTGLACYLGKTSLKIPRDEIWVNVVRAFGGSISVLGTYTSVRYIGIGDSMALVYSSPIWTNILSYFILHEPFYLIQILVLPILVVGITLIAHPALIVSASYLPLDLVDENLLENDATLEGIDQTRRLMGITIALLTSLAVSSQYIALKFRKMTPVQTATFYLGLTSVCMSLSVMSIVGSGNWPENFAGWFYLVTNGVFSWMAQSLVQWALANEDAGKVAIMRTFEVPFNYLLSWIFIEDQIYWTSILGSASILTSILLVMINGIYQRHRDRKRNETSCDTCAQSRAKVDCSSDP